MLHSRRHPRPSAHQQGAMVLTSVFPLPSSTMLNLAAMWWDSCSLEASKSTCWIMAILSVTKTVPKPSLWSFSFQSRKNCLNMGVSPPSGNTWICRSNSTSLVNPIKVFLVISQSCRFSFHWLTIPILYNLICFITRSKVKFVIFVYLVEHNVSFDETRVTVERKGTCVFAG